jgi:cytochrome c553
MLRLPTVGSLPNRILYGSLVLALVLLFASTGLIRAADSPSGGEIFASQCARCHGKAGQGTKRFSRRLEGDRSVDQLAELVRKTMPEDDPGTLSATEAKAVAAYVHSTFYSRVARERNRPARVELARLTVRQYRQSVADLVGSFRNGARRPVSIEQGLKAEYFRNRRFNKPDLVLERTDPQVAFDFSTESAVPGKTEPHEFSIRWNGSLLAPETGEYEFVIRTEHAARLWINDLKKPVIDAWVKSGKDTEFRGTVFLVNGRSYPLRLEYSKAKQGVDDSKKNKDKIPSPKSSMFLLWKSPHQALEVVPARYLSPRNAVETFTCTTPFPPDDRSYGWERGTTVSKEWDEATTDGALETVAYITAHLAELSGAREGEPTRADKLRNFCQTFAERAFRRPLTDAQRTMIDKVYTSADPDTGMKRTLLMVLLSPHFLYREVGANGKGDNYDVASRLSFGLWDSIPDRELLDAAKSGKLKTNEGVRAEVARMMADGRAAAKLHGFLLQWLKADHVGDLQRDQNRFPGFDPLLVNDLRASLDLFLDDVVWSESSDFRRLLLSDEVFVNERLAKFYNVKPPDRGKWTKVRLDDGKRAGAVTHPFLLTMFASSTDSSPIHRGVFLARGVLGVALRPPPEAVAPLAPDLHPSLTTRERVLMQTKPAACMTCHGVINPLGFTLENFDAVGRFRDKDRGKPVDATGSYQARDGKLVKVVGPRELGAFLADSPEVHTSFAEQLFHHLIQQSVQAYGPDTLEKLRHSFASNGYNVRKLAIEVIVTAARPD